MKDLTEPLSVSVHSPVQVMTVEADLSQNRTFEFFYIKAVIEEITSVLVIKFSPEAKTVPVVTESTTEMIVRKKRFVSVTDAPLSQNPSTSGNPSEVSFIYYISYNELPTNETYDVIGRLPHYAATNEDDAWTFRLSLTTLPNTTRPALGNSKEPAVYIAMVPEYSKSLLLLLLLENCSPSPSSFHGITVNYGGTVFNICLLW